MMVVGKALLMCVFAMGLQYYASFQFGHTLHKVGLQPLLMGGGRSPAEKLMSKRQMFKELRSKLNEAAKIPGFFEVGEGPPVSFNG
jgi:hypothetical protein